MDNDIIPVGSVGAQEASQPVKRGRGRPRKDEAARPSGVDGALFPRAAGAPIPARDGQGEWALGVWLADIGRVAVLHQGRAADVGRLAGLYPQHAIVIGPSEEVEAVQDRIAEAAEAR